ncbi:MAG: hypothetical protein L6264_04250 [Weeksellaceae bacterium]|nr:hypothetical protein [Bacteroidota bacterium]MCG2780137.1 hypothetical protein [Weeksellaceae bacterium]
MRLNNRNKQGRYNFLGTLFLLAFLFGVIAFTLEKYRFDILGSESVFLIIVPAVFLCVFYLRGRQIFEYDSDGEALNFKNRNVLVFFDKPISDEFPKYKLMNYEIVNAVIFKRLFITISSKKNHPIILKYDVSYLTKKELNDLKISLSKVIKTNQEIKRENNS